MGVIRPGLPPSSAPDQVLKSQGQGQRPKWEFDAGSSLFRGDWVDTPTVLHSSYDFSGGVIPPEFTTQENSAIGVVAAIPTGSAPIDGIPLGSPSHCVQVDCRDRGTNRFARMDLNLAALGIPDIVKVKWWWGGYQDLAYYQWVWWEHQFLVNSNAAVAVTEKVWGWRAAEANATSSDAVTWRHISLYSEQGDSGTYPGGTYVTNVEIHTRDTEFAPYARGEFVTHGGSMWRSELDENADQPGTGASWTEVLELPAHVGTTAERPAPATAGAGYDYFDTTLNKPIWVNAAANGWVDATGTAVV